MPGVYHLAPGPCPVTTGQNREEEGKGGIDWAGPHDGLIVLNLCGFCLFSVGGAGRDRTDE